MTLSNKDQQFINIAAEEAMSSDCLMQHGCVAVLNGKVIGRGFNHLCNSTSDGFVVENQYSCHAEVSALREAFYKINGCNSCNRSIKYPKHSKDKIENLKKLIIYVVRVDSKSNKLKNSAPCIDCVKMMSDLNIKRVVFSDEHDDFQKVKPKNYEVKFTTYARRPCSIYNERRICSIYN
jgi:tRNA(Arg) A34 adenosine deaminase TadA